ncbi:MAG: hypothetical protein WBQ03_09250 [Candidatus Sulfotelmatobacter sp.]
MSKFAVLGSVLLLSVLSYGQSWRGVPGYCPYGCGPYIPLITTPSLALTTFSPNPVGATNATGGLIAGATNSTLSEISGDTDAVYTVPVWYSGGQIPIISPMAAEPDHPWRERGMREFEGENRPGRERGMRRMEAENQMEHGHMMPEHGHMMGNMMGRMEPGQEMNGEQQAKPAWVFIGASQQPAVTGNWKPAKRTYTNDDVTRQNQQNGVVKYDHKTEKI